jgi:hypothetical protein
MTSAVQNDCACPHVHHHQRSLSDRLFTLLEKVSAVVLGVFAAHANMALFLSFFAAGTALGVYQYMTSGSQEDSGHGGSSCSQGFLEQLTKVKLPRFVSLGVNLAITWCHIDHHTSVFVPIIGLGLGTWVGQTGSSLLNKVGRSSANIIPFV